MKSSSKTVCRLNGFIAVFVILSILTGCEKELSKTPITLFTLVPSDTSGIDFVNQIEDVQESNILLYANFYGGAGVGVGDFNNDGLQDLYFAGNMVPDKLYFNQGNLVFKDLTKKAGIRDDGGWSTGVTVADIDNDGDQDIYVSRELHDYKPEWRKNLLYVNDGKGNFTESAEAFGIANTDRTRHATFLDYDKDGKLDLLLLTQPPNPGSLSALLGSDLAKPEYAIKLLKNKGGFFEDVTAAAGIFKTGFPNAVSASDLNNDGWTDLYIANDFYAPDFVFINNQDGTFTDVLHKALKQTSFYSMGVDIADINNDLLLDIFVLDMVSEDNFRLKSNMGGMNIDSFWKVVKDGGGYQYMYNTLQLNNGNSTFSNVAQYTGMAATDWSWSNLLADFDNDGFKDAYITNGLYRDIRNTDADKKVAGYINAMRQNWLREHPDGGNLNSIWDLVDLEKAVSFIPSQPLRNYAYKNNGNLDFENTAKNWGLDDESFSNGSAYADLDNDGDLDLVVNNINEKAFVYINNSEKMENSNFLRINLGDPTHNTVFGSRIELYAGVVTQMYETTNVRGIYSTSESIAHFGVGAINHIDSVIVTWPNQKKTIKKNIKVNQVLDIAAISSQQTKADNINNKTDLIFEEHTIVSGIDFVHKENEYEDYDKQILLPHKLSQFGPALAIGDVDNDGQDDFYVGGAANQKAGLFIQQENGEFKSSNEQLFNKEAPYEDVDAIFVDINKDGFQDLFVVSGGNKWVKNDFHYTHRLYLNKGHGDFKKGAILNAQRSSGSVVVGEDYDNDGDIDLFVGGRHTPGEYPSPSSSMLLTNENGQLVNTTETLAKEFLEIGMVTDATWADYDNDNDKDLIIVGEWMPIAIFENTDGMLSKTEMSDFKDTHGWWFSIEKGDFDNDGDIDFIAGNLGHNYKYKTSKEKPFDIYFNDFDENGNNDIVLGYYNQGKHYPLRGFSCSSQQIPGLKDKIQKYDAFATMELEEVYGPEKLNTSLYYKADMFTSVYIENLGKGKFKYSPLPYAAQLSNLNDMLIQDFDKDGNLDILGVQNLYVSEIETPRNDAGTGLLLIGDGKGSFKDIPGLASGFFASGDAKKIKILKSGTQEFLLVANNNDALQAFIFNNQLNKH